MLSQLYKVAEVSQSGYYNYFSERSKETRAKREIQDEQLGDLILMLIILKVGKRYKQIKMTLKNTYKINFNLKRIRRITRKYNITC